MTMTITKPPITSRLEAILLQVFPRLLGAVFLWAAVHKILAPESIGPVLAFDGVPDAMIRPATWGVIGVEFALAALLILFKWARKPAVIASIVLLIVYSVQLGVLLLSDNSPPCGCTQAVLPGEDVAQRNNLMGLARNICLIIPALWVWIQLAMGNPASAPPEPPAGSAGA